MAVDFETPQEDLRNWIVDNWETAVFDCIGLALSTMVVDAKKDMNDVVDRDETADFISERVKTGILNVLDTYDDEIPKSLKVEEYRGKYHGRDFYVCKCPMCGCHLDGNQVQKYCYECGQRLEWEQWERGYWVQKKVQKPVVVLYGLKQEVEQKHKLTTIALICINAT